MHFMHSSLQVFVAYNYNDLITRIKNAWLICWQNDSAWAASLNWLGSSLFFFSLVILFFYTGNVSPVEVADAVFVGLAHLHQYYWK